MSNYHFTGARRQGTFWQKHSLSIVLSVILTVQTIIALLAGHHVWLGEQEVNNQPAEAHEFWIWFGWEYNISLVADTFGVILIVLLSKRLEETGSAESTHTETESSH